jgi:hypothetical protein
MSGRSSPRSGLAALAALAALELGCGHRGPPAPEADPAAARARASALLDNSPSPGAVPVCKPADLGGALTLTFPTLLRLAGKPVGPEPENAAWINPAELDAAAARQLADGGTGPSTGSPTASTTTATRQAAAAFLAAPGYVVYRVDNVNAPLALGVKELKIGTVSARAVRFEPSGQARCVQVFVWQNDKARSDWAIERSNLARVDPVVAKALQDDLRDQYLRHAPRGR